MAKSLFLSFDSKMQIVSTIDNLIIAKRLYDSGLSLPGDTYFVGNYYHAGGGSLFEKGVSFLFGSTDFVYDEPPAEDAPLSMDYRFAFDFQSPLIQKWQDLLAIFGENEEIQKHHTKLAESIAEIYCDDCDMSVEGTFIPGGLRIMVLGFDGFFHEIFKRYQDLKVQLEEAVHEWSNRQNDQEANCDDEVA
ncbi:hypothetical protein [Brevibacillus sp. 179-C9.3 HS]|uniref:hypothetical protein n=1 Tax=unclassified Brevibacillus TaxID=2684853 RepID=UPI0039A07645